MDELTVLENSHDARQKLAAVERLVKSKTLNRVSKDPRFATALASLAAHLRSSEVDEVWSAAAAVARVAVASRSLSQAVRDLMSTNVIERPKSIPDFEDVDNRKYAVSAVRFSNCEWRASFFATVAVTEESAESVREEAISGLLESTADVASALDLLSGSLQGIRHETSDVSASIAKRLRRILKSVRDAWAVGAQEPGDRIGLALALLVEQPFRRFGPPTGTLRRELSALVASNVHQSVRARFSFATDPRTYEPIDVTRRWTRPHEWAEWVTEDREFADLRRDVCEALRLLVRAGVTDDRLLKVVELTSGNPQVAMQLRESVVLCLPDTTSEAVSWLRGRETKVRGSDLADESRLRDVDSILANALVEIQRTSPATPDLSEAIRAASRVRNLALIGSPGAKVEYSPLHHSLEGGHRAGVRNVRLLEPGVEAVAGVQSRVVRKALVEVVQEESTE